MKTAILAAAVAAAALAGEPLAAAELPSLAAGLWEMKMTRGDQTSTEKKCVLPGERAAFLRAMEAGGDCKQEVLQDGDAYLVQTDCALGGIGVKGRTRITGDFKTRVEGELSTAVAGTDGREIAPPSTATLSGARVGDCGPNGAQ